MAAEQTEQIITPEEARQQLADALAAAEASLKQAQEAVSGNNSKATRAARDKAKTARDDAKLRLDTFNRNKEEFDVLTHDITYGTKKAWLNQRKKMTPAETAGKINQWIALQRDNPSFIRSTGVNSQFLLALLGNISFDSESSAQSNSILQTVKKILDVNPSLVTKDIVEKLNGLLSDNNLVKLDEYSSNYSYFSNIISVIASNSPKLATTDFILNVEKLINKIPHRDNKIESYVALSAMVAANAGTNKINTDVIDAVLRQYEAFRGSGHPRGFTEEKEQSTRAALVATIEKNINAWDWSHADAILTKIEELQKKILASEYRLVHSINVRDDYASILLKFLQTKGALPNQAFADRLKALQVSSENPTFLKLLGDMRAIPVLPNPADYQKRSIFPVAQPT